MKSWHYVEFKYFPMALILLYVPFHLTEEAIYNFPLWMFEHYGLPKPLSYPHWLINNAFFLLGLLIGLYFFLKDKIHYLSFGFAILIWGLMNSMEHFVFSIIDNKISPGFYTSILFFIISGMGTIKLIQDKKIYLTFILKSLGIALCYWFIPILLIVSLGTTLVNIFP